MSLDIFSPLPQEDLYQSITLYTVLCMKYTEHRIQYTVYRMHAASFY